MKRIIYSFLFVALSLVSCTKYLDKKSNNGITVPATLSDLQALLDDGTHMNVQTTPGLSEASADNYFLRQTTYGTRNERMQAVYRWIPYDNYSFPNDWSAGYTPIYNSNYCLEMIEEIPVDNANRQAWNNVKGSALFYRAYYFLQLAWTFSKAWDENTAGTDAGIPLRLTSDFNVGSTRATVKDTYEKVILDAMESVTYLPDLPGHPYRPSKGGVYGLLARTYLSMRQYDSAYRYANLCLGIKNNLMDYNGDPDLTGDITGEEAPYQLFNKEIIFYSEARLSHSQLTGPTFARVDTFLYESYDTNDWRREAYFFPGNGYQKFKGYYTGGTIIFSGIATDEMFLTRAECLARAGNTDAALDDLNMLLSKRFRPGFMPITAATAGDALAIILKERRKELLFRGLRFIDIKRLNKEGANIVPERMINGERFFISPNDNRYALPIPREVIIQSGIEQNP